MKIKRYDATNGWVLDYPEVSVSSIVVSNPLSASSTTFLRGDGQWATPTATDSTKLPLTGGTLTGDLTISNEKTILMSGDYYINKKFDMLENASPQYILLCASAANNEVMGTIHIDRSSSNWQAAMLDVVVTARSNDAVQGAALRTLQVLQSGERYDIVTLTYGTVQYVAVRYTGNVYPETTARFTGRMKSTGSASLLTVVGSSDVSSVNEFDGTTYSFQDVDTMHFRGNVGIGTDSPADKFVVVDGSTKGMEIGEVSSKMRLLSYDRTNNAEVGMEIRGDSVDIKTNNTSRLFANDTGVGFGTTQPQDVLHIKDGSDKGLEFGEASSKMRIMSYDRTANAEADMQIRANSIEFYSNSAARINLLSNGNVGIGNSNPVNKLDVSGIASISNGLRLGSTGSGEGLFRHNPGTGNQGIAISTGGLSSSYIKLFVEHTNDGGGVGIGTTTPSEKLEVDGAGIFDGNASSRVLYLRGNGNIVQFQGASNQNVWEVVGREANFYIYNNDLSKYSLFIDDGTNNIGINGQGSPSHALDVIGNIKASNDMYAARYYDLNNTSYYIDSGSTSVMNAVQFQTLQSNKTSYGEPNTENFYRLKIQNQGGTHNDVGLGQTASGNLGYNVTAANAHIFYEGTNGEIARLQPSGLALNHSGTGTVDSKSITFTSQFNSTDVVRVLKTNSSGELLFNGNELATESYVGTQISNLVDSSPDALNTLNELAAALGDDANFSTTVTNSIATKLPLTGGTLTGGLVAGGGISGLTISNGISGSNYNITGVNELQFNDPGEGIRFMSGSSGTMDLKIIDDSNDNILEYSGSNAKFRVAGSLDIKSSNPVLTLEDTGTTTGNAYIDYQAGTSLKVHAGADPITFIAGNSEKARITAGNGYLGVGTTNPSYAIDVQTSSAQIRAYGTTAKLWAQNSGGGQASLELKNSETHFRFIADNGGYSIYDQIDAAERFAIDTNGNSTIRGNLTVITTFPRIFLTDTDSNSDYSIINANGQLSFYDDTNSAYRMVVEADGKVGVGTQAPSTRMHIVENSTATALTVSNTSSNGTVVKLTSSGDNRNLYLQTDHIYSNGNLYFGDNSYETIIRGSVLKSEGHILLNSPVNNNAPISVKSLSNNRAIHIEETGTGSESWQLGVDADGNMNFYNSGSSSYAVRFNDNNTATFASTVTASNGKLSSVEYNGSDVDKVNFALSGSTLTITTS